MPSPSGDHPTEPHRRGPTQDDRFVTQGPPTAWSYSPQQQRFTVLRLHQQGGLGRLMVAKDCELNREIALKEILPTYADSEESRRRFIREAEITGALEHPGVVPVYSLGEFPDGRPYYAMRFIKGVDLRTALDDFHTRPGAVAEKRLEFRQLLQRFVAVCQAIHYAHNRKVLHRDLKPANIMLGDFGETLVVDWGLARMIDDPLVTPDFESAPILPSDRASTDRTQAGRIVGTLPYVSPEQAQGRMDLMAPASDIYGLGATLYHILTGRAPFDADDLDLIPNVQQGRFPSPRSVDKRIPKALEAICLKAMAKRPQDRYATARDLALDVERYLGDERVQAHAEPLAGRAWRWIRHHRALVMSSMAAGIVAVAALSTGVVLLTAANRRERAATDLAEKNFAEAEEQRKAAERNFQLAQDAVRDYFTRVSEETLLNQPGMQPLRDSLLRQALTYYQQFLDQRQSDPGLRNEVAQAHFFVGRVTEAIDTPAKALPHYEAAADMQKELVDGGNDSESLSAAYAQTLNARGRALQRLGRRDEARGFYRQACERREKLAAAKPDDAERARAHASSVMNLGLMEIEDGRPQEALPLLQRAQTLRLAHRESPQAESRPFIRDLGMGYYNLAMAQMMTGDQSAAESNLFKAISSFEKLAKLEPNDLVNRHQIALCRRMIATAKEVGDDDEAIELFEQARDELRELSLRNPEVPEYVADLAGIEMNLGARLEAMGQAEAALRELESGAGHLRSLVDQHVAVPRYRRDLGVALYAAGKVLAGLDRRDDARTRLEESKTVLERLVRENPSNVGYGNDLQATLEALEEVDAI
jgi:serine/threonine-protein kinase